MRRAFTVLVATVMLTVGGHALLTSAAETTDTIQAKGGFEWDGKKGHP